MRPVWQTGALVLIVACAAFGTVVADTLKSGTYSFTHTDDVVQLLSVSGAGSAADPIVLSESYFTTGESVLTVEQPASPPPHLYLETVITNRSGQTWIGFELELREIRSMPSTDRDGLSFDQIAKQTAIVTSDRFARGNRTFEPGDRMLFWGGSVDHGAAVRLSVLITDTTPGGTFYVLQRPQLATARLDGAPPAGVTTAAKRDPAPAAVGEKCARHPGKSARLPHSLVPRGVHASTGT